MTKTECADVKDLLPQWIRGELGESDRAVVLQHISSCASCPEEVELLRRIQAAAFSTPASLASEIKSVLVAEMAVVGEIESDAASNMAGSGASVAGSLLLRRPWSWRLVRA